MATYPKTGSIFDNPALGSSTRTALSTQVIIRVNDEPVGAVQSFQPRQARTTRRIAEVGTDGTIEIVPNAPTNVTLTISRMAFDGLSLPEAFSRGFRNIHAQRIPFDIVVIDQFTGTGDDAVITTYHNCWFSALDHQYQAETYVVVENATVDVEFVSSVRAGDSVALSQGVGGSRQISGTQFDSVETGADTGQTRGSLDFPGLISAAF